MRSAELARLAGVTVRTVRHYHHVGVLAEPRRGINGYRSYDVHDLIRLLRIRHLASLGIPLDRMAAILDDAADGSTPHSAALLDELDSELQAQIERLERQRDLVGQLRQHGAPPDLPPEMAPFAALFASPASAEIARIDRDQTILLAHLAGDGGMRHLTHFYERLSDPMLAPVVAEVSQGFALIGADSSDEQIESFVDTFVGTLAPVVAEFAQTDTDSTNGFGGASALLDEYTADVLNEQQRYVLAQLEMRLGAQPPTDLDD